jgi:hypothetical protein
MLRISSKAGVRSDPSPHGSVRLIDKPPIVTSVVIWSVQTGAGACDFRCASRATSCLNCLEEQRLELLQRLLAQPTGGRHARDQQRHAVCPHVQDVLAAVNATELTHREVAERLGRHC